VGLGPLKLPTDEQLLACGPSLPDRDVRIIDPVSGKEAPVGQVGEIAVTGGCMVGYWGRPDKTAEVIRDGWLFTGDVGRMDADGYVYVRGRTSERLTVGGEAWYPRDVEEALMEHAAVRAAALIGLPHPTLGESPRAYVVLRNGTSAMRTELIAYAEGRVGRRLSLLDLQLVASLPMTPTGKISKSQLRDQALRGP
jgi:acyl-CoA synthetase (AMP-forming)/AMP-acid ligase II